jgi:hypothetical protein
MKRPALYALAGRTRSLVRLIGRLHGETIGATIVPTIGSIVARMKNQTCLIFVNHQAIVSPCKRTGNYRADSCSDYANETIDSNQSTAGSMCLLFTLYTLEAA